MRLMGFYEDQVSIQQFAHGTRLDKGLDFTGQLSLRLGCRSVTMRIRSLVAVLVGALVFASDTPGYLSGGGYGEGGTTSGTTLAGKLTATVGPGFTIILRKGTVKVTSLKRGTYSILVDDKSSKHNFHLTGLGVNLSTKVGAIIKKTWTVTLKPGTYKYFCDPHSGTMKGTFKVTA